MRINQPQKKPKGNSEAVVLKQCMAWLKARGVFCWRQNTGAFKTENGGYFRSSMAGVADILGILPDGRFLAVECKRENGGVVSDAQKKFLASIGDNNGVAIVANSVERLRDELVSAGVKIFYE